MKLLSCRIRICPSSRLLRLLTHIERPIADEFHLDILDIGLLLRGRALLLRASVILLDAVLVHDDLLLGRVGRGLVVHDGGALGSNRAQVEGTHIALALHKDGLLGLA